jgi:tetratricopeptide (TPR) repeat protein
MAMRVVYHRGEQSRLKEFLMRYTPAAVALSLLAAVTGSMGSARTSDPIDPRAQVLLQDGRTMLAKGNVDGATDSLESALTLDPANAGILISLGDAAREAGLQGKAIHYYRTVLDHEPNNVAAIAGEGAALAEKGAIDKAKASLARIEGLCGRSCPETAMVSKALAAGPKPQVVAAETVTPKPDVQAN